jgi:hypothetical protein
MEHEALQQTGGVRREAERGVEIFTNRYQLGSGPYLQVVSAETIELQKTSVTKSTYCDAEWIPAFF